MRRAHAGRIALPCGGAKSAFGIPIHETSRAGVGFGLGFACVLDPTVLGGLSVPGEYYWGGAASTAFWITPAEDLAVVFMTQVRPSSTYPIRRELRALVYGAIVD
jgi:CubicO group peptidase (beta-lactamase class C family)